MKTTGNCDVFGKRFFRLAQTITVLFLLLFATKNTTAQNISINTTGAAGANCAILDVSSPTQGLLIPRVALTNVITYAPLTGAAVDGLIVYSTTAPTNGWGTGFYYWSTTGAKWVYLFSNMQPCPAWLVTKNTGLTDNTSNFLGTTDAISIRFTTNNIERAQISAAGYMGVNTAPNANYQLYVSSAVSGIYGASTLVTGTGVLGTGNIAVATLAGGSGGAFASTNVGVYGYGNNTADSWGVYGKSDNNNGTGVEGICNAAASANQGTGGFFETAQTQGAGVAGYLGALAGASYFPGTAVSGYQFQSGVGYESIMGETTPIGNGSGYGITLCNSSTAGQIAGNFTYSFGTLGQSTSTARRTGGILGLSQNVGTWAALGYTANNGNTYGAYWTNSNNGAGKIMRETNVVDGIGMGGYGDVIGGWVRGNVYGMNIKGERYSLYVDGKTYTNDVIAQVSDNQNSDRIVTYVPTSTSVDVYTRGTAKLINGKATIEYPENFKKLISTSEPVTVTITAIGECNGLHLEKKVEGVDGNKNFSVSENANGSSNVEFTWIAIGTRKGYETPNNPQEILSKDYDSNMQGVMYDENNPADKGTSIWWDGSTLHFTTIPEHATISSVGKVAIKRERKDNTEKK